MKILIFGASGSGTTTLGREIEKKSGFKHLDADDYYWEVTEPPFLEKISLAKRNELLMTDFTKHENVIISGSLVSWGQQWQSAFDLAIFIYLNQVSRMKRLEKRELERYGNKLLTDEQTQSSSKAFIDWAAKYDEPAFTGRSLAIHNEWIKLLSCPLIRLDGAMKLKNKIEKVLAQIKTIANAQE